MESEFRVQKIMDTANIYVSLSPQPTKTTKSARGLSVPSSGYRQWGVIKGKGWNFIIPIWNFILLAMVFFQHHGQFSFLKTQGSPFEFEKIFFFKSPKIIFLNLFLPCNQQFAAQYSYPFNSFIYQHYVKSSVIPLE